MINRFMAETSTEYLLNNSLCHNNAIKQNETDICLCKPPVSITCMNFNAMYVALLLNRDPNHIVPSWLILPRRSILKVI